MNGAAPPGLVRPLTPRQTDVVKLAAKGFGTTEIARELEISYFAVRMHINALADQMDNPKTLTPLRLVQQWARANGYCADASDS